MHSYAPNSLNQRDALDNPEDEPRRVAVTWPRPARGVARQYFAVLSALDMNRQRSSGYGRGGGRQTWRARKREQGEAQSRGGLAASKGSGKRIGLHVGHHKTVTTGPLAIHIKG